MVRKRESIDTAAVADQRLVLMRDHGSGLPRPRVLQVKCDLITEISVEGGD